MGLGLLGSALVGAGKGVADGVVKLSLMEINDQIETSRAERIAQMQSRIRMDEDLVKRDRDVLDIGRTADAKMEATKRLAPEQNKLDVARKLDVDYNPQILTAERDKKTADLKANLDFTTQNIGQMAKNERTLAQARHIVDPSYSMVQKDDGSVLMVNARNPKDTFALTDKDGKPVVKRDTAEFTAISTAISGLKTQIHENNVALKEDPTNKTLLDEQKLLNSRMTSAVDKLLNRGEATDKAKPSVLVFDPKTGGFGGGTQETKKAPTITTAPAPQQGLIGPGKPAETSASDAISTERKNLEGQLTSLKAIPAESTNPVIKKKISELELRLKQLD